VQDLANLISTVGFPSLVALYLLVTVNKSLQELTKAITELKEVVERGCGK